MSERCFVRGQLLRSAAHRGRMDRQLEPWSGVAQLVAIPLQYRQVAVDEIADINVFPSGLKATASGNTPTLTSPAVVSFLPSDLEGRHVGLVESRW